MVTCLVVYIVFELRLVCSGSVVYYVYLLAIYFVVYLLLLVCLWYSGLLFGCGFVCLWFSWF